MTAIARVPEYMFSQKPYIIMYFQFFSRSLWGALLFIVLFSGCKKDTVSSTSAEKPYWAVTQEQYQQSISSLKSDEDKHFFDFTYASLQNNAVIKTASSRVDSTEILRALAVKLIQLNKQQPFITGVVQRIGHPMWDKAAHLNAPSTQNPGVFLPFASLDADSTQGFLVAIPDEYQNWILKLIYRKDVENNIHQPDSMPNFYFNVAMFFNFDSLIFGKINKRYGTILANSEGGIVGTTDRGCVVYSTLSCYTMALTGGVSERDCNTWWTVYCYGEPWGGSAGGGGYPNTSGGGPGIDITNGGGGGSSTTPFTASDAAFAAFWGKCKAGKFGDDVVGGLVGDDIALCETMEHINSLGLFEDDQLALLYKDPLLRSLIQTYLEAHPNDPIAMQIVSVLLEKVRRLKITVSEVTKILSLVNAVGLSPTQVEWLTNHAQVISNLSIFLNTNQPLTQEKKDLILLHLNTLISDSSYYFNNLQESFPLIGTEKWAEAVFHVQGYEEEYKKLKQAEKDLVWQYPIAALTMRGNKHKAMEQTNLHFGHSGTNDKSDAFRHGMFQILNTLTVGETVARLFANAHETETPLGLTLEREMDLFNNERGFEIAALFSYVHPITPIVTSVILAMNNGYFEYLTPLDWTASAGWPVGNNGITILTKRTPTNQ
jgi:hypothetical protein